MSSRRFNFNSRPMHSLECRWRMEPEVSKSVRGKERMEEFERKLAADVEERVRKQAKEEHGGDIGVSLGSSSGSKTRKESFKHIEKPALLRTLKLPMPTPHPLAPHLLYRPLLSANSEITKPVDHHLRTLHMCHCQFQVRLKP